MDYSEYNSAVNNTVFNGDFRRTNTNGRLLAYSNIEQFEITGTEFNDSLKGGAADDTIKGEGGNDSLLGLAGNDSIDGGAGNDYINSGTGNDSVTGGAGNDSIDGSVGADILIGVNPNQENAGADEIDTLVGGADSDRFILGNRDQVFYDDAKAVDAGTSSYALITDFNADAGDTIQLYGTKSNYRLADSPLENISGTAIYLIKEGDEPDELIAILKDVTGLDLNSDAFEAFISAIVTGDENNNNLTGTPGNDLIEGLGGNDTLNGNAGNDTIDGGEGTNTLNGGEGNDVLINNFGTVNGGAGNDTLSVDYSGYGNAVGNTRYNDRFELNNNSTDLLFYYNIEQFDIKGTDFNDIIKGGSGDDTLDGGAGNDILNAGAGSDLVLGGAGNDTIDGGNLGDTIDGGEGIDHLANFSAAGSTENITVNSISSSNIDIAGTSITNFESLGNITTGSGDDTFNLGAYVSRGNFNGNGGFDTLIVDYSDYAQRINTTNSRLSNPVTGVTLLQYSKIERFNLTATDFDDSIDGLGNVGNTIDGGAGFDYLKSFNAGSETTDITIDLTTSNNINFGSTNITNFESIGTATTGSGNDRFIYNSASSTSGQFVIGGAGNDTLSVDYSGYGNAVGNTRYNDRFELNNNSTDLLFYYNIEQFDIKGTDFNDTIKGGSGDDTLDGGAGNDSLRGNGGEDIIIGVNANRENAGADEIDTLVGGAGGDRFVLGDLDRVFYDDGNIVNAATTSYARITDFDADAGDTIQLHGSKSDYRLSDSPLSNISGTAVYLIKEGDEPDELIAILQWVTGLDLNSDAFVEAEDILTNNAPLAKDDSYSVDEDTSLSVDATVGLLANDVDADSDALTAELVIAPENGTLSFNNDGSFEYTPNPDFNGSDNFTYRAKDQFATSELKTVTLTVNSVNDEPVAVDDSYNLDEDNTLTVNESNGLLANDLDVDSDALTAVLVTAPENGTLSFNDDGSFSYTPDPDFNGSDSFTYRASDGVAISELKTVTLNIEPVDDRPVAVDDNYTVDEDSSLTVDEANGLLANDSDPNNDALTAVLVTAPEHGTLSLNDDGSFEYTPNPDFDGSDSFTYRASDGSYISEIGTVTLTINSINDDPIAVDDSYTLNEDSNLSINAANGVLANDSDVEDSSLTLSLINDVESGSLVLNPNGSFTYNPNTDFSGTDSFTYQVSDSDGSIQTATVTLTVESVNDNPIAVNESYSVDEDNTLTVNAVDGILANDSDAESATLTLQLVSDVSNGSLTLNNDGSFEYTPNPNFSGTDSFTYSIDDGNGGVATATATIVVNEVADDAPSQIQLSNTTIDENIADGAVVGTVNTIDPDVGDTHTYELLEDSNGRFALVNNEIQVVDSSLIDAETNATHELTIRSTDASGLSIEETFTITVNNVNEAPSQVQLSNTDVDENSNNGTVIGTLATVDPDSGDNHTYSLVDNAEGRFSIINGNQIAIADQHQIDFETSPTHTIIVRTTDEGGLTYDQSLTITINDLPEPDLAFDNDSIDAPATAEFGQTFNVAWTVNNDGDGITTTGWQDKIYLSTDSTLSDDDLELSTTTINNPVAVNGQYAANTSVTLPLDNTIADGNYYILIKTDADSNQPELDENNNVASQAIGLTVPPTPDLIVSSIVAPTEAFSGQDIEVTWVITNTGEGDATGTWTDTIYLSDDAEVGEDQQYGSFSFTGTIEAGQSIERKQIITLPIDLNDTRHIIIKTDANNQLFEFNDENNNTLVNDETISVELSPFPNLKVDSVNAPDTAFSSQNTVIEWFVTNYGTGATSSPVWSDGVWLSFDQFYDETDVYLGSANNPSYLGVGETYRNSLEVTLPQGIDDNYYFLVVADAGDRVLELGNEGDNLNYGGPTDVSLTPAPDLKVNSVNARSFAFSGQSVPVSWTVTNEGLGKTQESSWIDSIYLSTDEVWDEDDEYLGRQFHQGALDIDESYSKTKDVSLPIGISGDYYFIVRTDSGEQVYESVADINNDGFDNSPTSISLTPPPDLEVEYLNVPTTALASQDITLEYLVTNYGATPTPNSSWTDTFYLSEDGQLDTETDIRLGTYRRRGFLDSGASYEESVTFTLTDGLEGDYQIFVVSDSGDQVFELDKDNNILAANNSVTIASEPADLKVTAIDALPTAEAGKALLLNWTVTNQGIGNTATERWIDYVWLSVDDVVGRDTLLGSFTHDGLLDVNQSYDRSELITLPFDVGGDYNLYVTTDVSKRVYEAENETNNTSDLLPVNIIQESSDLKVTYIDAPNVAASGESFLVNWTVTNQGAGKTNSNYWYDEVFLSRDPNLDFGSDISLGKVYRSRSLDDSGSYNASGTFELPQDVEGNYYVLINTDRFDQVFESSGENNNVTATTAATTISLSDTPDLVLSNIDAPSSGTSGQNIEVTWTVSNQGAATDGNWRDVFYLSRDQVFDRNSDTYLGFVEHKDGLASGASYTETTSLELPAGTSGPFYIYAVTDSGDRLYERNGENNNYDYDPQAIEVSLPPPADLVAGTITIPVNGVPGQDAIIEYTVNNQGDFPAEGRWTDSIYLSADGQWDIDDLLFAEVEISETIATGKGYSRTVTAPLPGVFPGEYQVIIRSDIRNTIVEADEANNLGASLEQFTLDVESLELGVSEAGEFAPGQSVYYRLDVPAGETLLLSLDNQSIAAANELYISYGKMPSRSDFDFGYEQSISPDQEIVVPRTKAGTYYVLAYGNIADSGAGYRPNFDLKAELLEFSLRSISTERGSNRGQVTLTLDGAKLTTDTVAQLVATDGTVVTASNIIWKDSTELWATFDLQGTEIGEYDVQIIDGAATDLLADSFTVTNGAVDNLDLQINAPSAVRPGQPGVVTINYTNTGETDLIAPLLEISSSNAQLRLASNSEFTGTSGLTLLGINTDGPGGILTPGATGTMSFIFEPTSIDTIIHNVRPVSYDEYNWDEAKNNFKPAYISQAAWDEIWANFTAEVGTDTADYQALLAENATYLSQLGDYTPDISRLVDFELQQASNYLSLSQRYHLSSFGRGGSFLGDIRAVVDDRGNVTIQNNGQYRFFKLQEDGTFEGYTGDYATLVKDGASYSLQETNGTVTVFGADGRLNYIEDTNGIRTTANYTEGQFTGFSDSLGNSLNFTFNDQGRITSTTDQDGRTTTYTYDETGEYLLGARDQFGSVSYTYSDQGEITSVTDANGVQVLYEYDDNGRIMSQQVAGSNQALSYSYGSAGEVTVTDANGATTELLLDEQGRVSRQEDALGRLTQFQYDSQGNLTGINAPENFGVTYSYDERGNLVSQINPLGDEVKFTYEPNYERLQTVTDARGKDLRYSYDERGNLTAINYEDGSSENFTVDEQGNTVESVNRRGIAIGYEYNTLGQVTRVDYQDGSADTYTYDDAGRLTSTTDASGTTSIEYDADNPDLMAKITYPMGRSLAYTYDVGGRRTQMVDQDGSEVNYSYDAAGRLAGLTDETGSSIVSYTYDDAGRLAREDNGNGTYTTYQCGNCRLSVRPRWQPDL